MCEALFPAVMQHLATAGAARDPCLPASLARQIHKHVLAPNQQQQLQQTRSQAKIALPEQRPAPADGADVGGDSWSGGGGGDLRAVQIILRSLEHLRRLHLRVVSGRKPGPPGSRASGREGWEAAVDRWEFVYGLEIDYLAVARVRAWECGAAVQWGRPREKGETPGCRYRAAELSLDCHVVR